MSTAGAKAKKQPESLIDCPHLVPANLPEHSAHAPLVH